MSEEDRAIPLPDSVSRSPTEPTIVTSRPSRIHTVPSPMRIRQWNHDHGSRSSRAGIFVSIRFDSTAVVMDQRYPAASRPNRRAFWGITTYFGSRAAATPALYTPNRVQSPAAT